jgi:hypothetical protein
MRMDALKSRDLRTYIEAAPRRRAARTSSASRRAWSASTRRSSIRSRGPATRPRSALSLGAQKDWIGGVVTTSAALERDDPKHAGIEKLFYSKAIEDDIFKEKIELERQAKGFARQPGRTKNEQALAIAEILQKWDKVKVDALNGEGAWITEHSSRSARASSHDPDKMRRRRRRLPAARSITDFTDKRSAKCGRTAQAWVGKTLPRIDAKRMFGTTVDADKKLAEMYGGLVTGDHLEMTTVSEEPIYPNVARKVSAQRAFVWKSAEDQLAYMREFGRFDPTDAWLHGMRDGANKYALMKVFGSKPKENFEELLAYAKNRTMGKPRSSSWAQWENGAAQSLRGGVGRGGRPIATCLERHRQRRDGGAAAGQARPDAVRHAAGQRHDLARARYQGIGFSTATAAVLRLFPGRRWLGQARGRGAAAHRHPRPAARRHGALRRRRRAPARWRSSRTRSSRSPASRR